ncbi:hypothetical protein B0T25DRAFT_632581 [Lasiosphaeria hispida]|uniref:SGNH hydrolase-type esterase domain-containing protein n=1 Tax=Lasiosphaeria hispida TaxID=260671 RepID=A0AAJ0HDP2_9PEZI|nr:hypothetical protein B0T25DRAFT_632581 [Lasiosphaeria hispida]
MCAQGSAQVQKAKAAIPSITAVLSTSYLQSFKTHVFHYNSHYRKNLRDAPTSAGHAVNYVGRHKNGDFADNHVEASGFVLSQIAEAAHGAAPLFQPNLALIEAGTNNCNSGAAVPDAGANVAALVRDVFAGCPSVTVVMATLMANKVAAQDACRVNVNRQYREVAAGFEREGARFVLVDMRGPEGPTMEDLFDSRHQNDRGYQKMAVVWKEGVDLALERGFVGLPAANGIPLDGGGEGGVMHDSMAGVAVASAGARYVSASLFLCVVLAAVVMY